MSDDEKPGLIGKIKDKLIRSKEKTAEEGRHLTGMPDKTHALRLPPGQHLVESELAGHLGVSRQPVREALQRLNTEGWVDLRPAQGAFVHEPTEEEADQLLTVRTLLEAEAARLAAANANAAGIQALEDLCAEGENAVAANRDIMGATDPKKAADGTIRKDFAESIEANSVHGSDSAENAAIEIAFFFSGIEIAP